jgi:cell division transport system ATP-binding protein
VIHFDQVSLIYPSGEAALKDVSFDVTSNEMVFLTGHSGAGKSTLLKLIMLMERPTHGKVTVNGIMLNNLSVSKIAQFRRNIGAVFQEHNLLFDRSVFDNVALPMLASGYRRKEINYQVHEALDKVGLMKKAKQNPIMLSGGQQQRVGIARAIVNNPDIILADEPTGNLDPSLSIEIMSLFQELSNLNTTILLATHDLALIARMDQRLLNLKKGELINNLA